MVNRKNKRCQHVGCTKGPVMSFPGDKKATRCKAHMLKGMVVGNAVTRPRLPVTLHSGLGSEIVFCCGMDFSLAKTMSSMLLCFLLCL